MEATINYSQEELARLEVRSYIARNYIKGLKNSISQLKIFPCKFPLVQDDILQIVIVLRIGYKKRNWKDILN